MDDFVMKEKRGPSWFPSLLPTCFLIEMAKLLNG